MGSAGVSDLDVQHGRHARAAQLVTVVLLAAIAWFAHFSGWRQTGFFSDDHSFAVLTMAWSPGDARHFADVLAFSYPEPQGRPLGFLLGLELPYLGYRAAGVFGMFAVGWLILSANTVLLYVLLARRLPRPMPVVAALMFLLFPADTTRPFLCHAHILQPSITFALVAAHLMLARRGWVRAIGYPVAGLCLVTYETAMLPLLAVPLLDLYPFCDGPEGRALRRDRHEKARPSGPPLRGHFKTAPRSNKPVLRYAEEPDFSGSDPGLRSTSDTGLPVLKGPLNGMSRFTVRRLVVHVAVLTALVGVVAVTRAHGGEYRAVGATGSKATLLAQVALGSVRGPLAAAQACVRRPWQQFLTLTHRPTHTVLMAVVAVLSGTAIGLGRQRIERPTVRRAALFGVVAVGVSYLLCFTHYPPTCEEGQSTSVHTAAALGAAALTAAVVGWGLLRSRRWTIAIAGVYFGLLFGHALDEQSAFATLWHERQSFWSQVLDQCPDLTDRTVILCDGTMPQPTWYMPVNLWSDAMVPAQVYQFPADYRLPPLLAAYPRTPGQEWRTAVQRDGAGRLVWRTPPCNCPAGQELAEGNTILLRVDNAGRVVRVSGTVDVKGRPFRLRSPPPLGTRASFPILPFYHMLIQSIR